MTPKHYTKGLINIAIQALLAVIEQDAPSLGPAYPSGYFPCHYHGTDGRRSIIGFILKAEYYDTRFEGHTLDYAPLRAAVNLSIGVELTSDDFALLYTLSECHDGAAALSNEKGGDFVEYMLDLLEIEVVTRNVPDQFKEHV